MARFAISVYLSIFRYAGKMLEEYMAAFNITEQYIPPRGGVTDAQRTCFLIGIVAIVTWLYRNASLSITRKKG